MNPDIDTLFEPVSTFDLVIIRAGIVAPWLGVAAAVVLLASITLFAFRSREPGRIEIFLGAYLFVAEFVFFTQTYHDLALAIDGGMVREAWLRLIGVLPLVLVAVGFARLGWAKHRARQP
jgi:hypothetical protein